MKDQFETAKLANDKGFNKKLHPKSNQYDFYIWMCKLQRWLREEHDILVLVDTNFFNLMWKIIIPHYELPRKIFSEDNFNTYDQALEKGLQEALKLIKRK